MPLRMTMASGDSMRRATKKRAGFMTSREILMPVALNEIDFLKTPFVEGPNGAYYVEPHRAFREFPVFRFPAGVPAPGEVVEINVKRDTRLSENQFSSLARAKGLAMRGPKRVRTNPGTQVKRAVVRVKRLPGEAASKFRLTLADPQADCKRWAWGAFVLYLQVAA